jgi:hypothetical protein
VRERVRVIHFYKKREKKKDRRGESEFQRGERDKKYNRPKESKIF